jgi:hypothetical protein
MNGKKCIYSIFPKLEGITKDGIMKIGYISRKNIYYHEKKCLLDNKITFFFIDNVSDYEKEYLHSFKFNENINHIIYNNNLICYKEKNYEKIMIFLYIEFILFPKINNNDTITKIAYEYYLYKLKFGSHVSDNILFINLFYGYYITSITNEIIKKFGVNIMTDMGNYHELYLFLKKNGYVDIFYKSIKKDIIKEYKQIHKNINAIPKKKIINDVLVLQKVGKK